MGVSTTPTVDDGKVLSGTYVWDTNTLAWIRSTGSTGSGTEVTVTNFPTMLTDAELRASPLDTRSQAYAKRIDEASATVTYIGQAAVGSSEGSAVWQILKMTESGSVTSITYADSNANFDNVWTNRASLSYG